MPLAPARIAVVLSLTGVAVACSSGGALLAADGGRSGALPATDAEAADADSADAPRPHVAASDAGSRADAKKVGSYPVTCEGLCDKADARLPNGCDTTKCVSQCKLRADEASKAPAGCTPDWNTYLECAVLGGAVTACAYNGKLTLAGCSDEEHALTTCVGTPLQCPNVCTTDLDCQSQCPVFGSGTACCDTRVGSCYASSSSCPN